MATVAKAVVHTVLSLCVTSFSEESLGDTAVSLGCGRGLAVMLVVPTSVAPGNGSHSNGDINTPLSATGVLGEGWQTGLACLGLKLLPLLPSPAFSSGCDHWNWLAGGLCSHQVYSSL